LGLLLQLLLLLLLQLLLLLATFAATSCPRVGHRRRNAIGRRGRGALAIPATVMMRMVPMMMVMECVMAAGGTADEEERTAKMEFVNGARRRSVKRGRGKTEAANGSRARISQRQRRIFAGVRLKAKVKVKSAS